MNVCDESPSTCLHPVDEACPIEPQLMHQLDHQCHLMIASAVFEAHPMRVLIDSGASCNFIAAKFCTERNIQTNGHPNDRFVSMGNGQRQPSGQTVIGALQLGPLTESVEFSVTELSHYNMILGHA